MTHLARTSRQDDTICDETTLRGTLLRLFNREGSMEAAIATWEREHGRPLQASVGFVLEVESEALAIRDAVDVMHALTAGPGSNRA